MAHSARTRLMRRAALAIALISARAGVNRFLKYEQTPDHFLGLGSETTTLQA